MVAGAWARSTAPCSSASAPGRAQDPGAQARRRRRVPPAVPARVADRGQHPSPEHHPITRRRGGRAALHRHALSTGGPGHPAETGPPPGAGQGPGHHGPGGQRAGRRPRPRARPPRRQAGQHPLPPPGGQRRPLLPVRLRAHQAGRRRGGAVGTDRHDQFWAPSPTSPPSRSGPPSTAGPTSLRWARPVPVPHRLVPFQGPPTSRSSSPTCANPARCRVRAPPSPPPWTPSSPAPWPSPETTAGPPVPPSSTP